MSTRGCVGVMTGENSWSAVFNHWDSYPSGLGSEVWKVVKRSNVKLAEFCQEMMSYNDWREFLNQGVCQYCGKKGVGQPCSISGGIIGKETDEKAKKAKDPNYQIQYPDPDAKNHDHDNSHHYIKSDDTEEALWIEWAYIFDLKRNSMVIFANTSLGTKKMVDGREVNEYGYMKVREIKLSYKRTPNWKLIAKKADKMYEKNLVKA